MSDPKKLCDGQGCEKPAVVHVTQVVNGVASHHHLCRECAEEKGISAWSGSPADVSGFIAQLGAGEPGSPEVAEEPCSFCGLTFERFKETGRLGCPQCYTSYEPSLRRLLERIHGAAQHVGKVYLPPDSAAADLDKQLALLRSRLQRAVEAEDFERAAVLRDQILELEPAG